jgi:hypothetical protein
VPVEKYGARAELVACSHLECVQRALQEFDGHSDAVMPRAFASVLVGVIVQRVLEGREGYLDGAQLMLEVPRVDSCCWHDVVAHLPCVDADRARERLSNRNARRRIGTPPYKGWALVPFAVMAPARAHNIASKCALSIP